METPETLKVAEADCNRPFTTVSAGEESMEETLTRLWINSSMVAIPELTVKIYWDFHDCSGIFGITVVREKGNGRNQIYFRRLEGKRPPMAAFLQMFYPKNKDDMIPEIAEIVRMSDDLFTPGHPSAQYTLNFFDKDEEYEEEHEEESYLDVGWAGHDGVSIFFGEDPLLQNYSEVAVVMRERLSYPFGLQDFRFDLMYLKPMLAALKYVYRFEMETYDGVFTKRVELTEPPNMGTRWKAKGYLFSEEEMQRIIRGE